MASFASLGMKGYVIYEKIVYICISWILAQLVDGSLGMGFGASSSSILLTYGIAPAIVSATVHFSEIARLLHPVHHIGNLKMYISQPC